MRQIDIDTWPRREHFNLYNSFEFPHFTLCANVDLTNLLSFVREKRVSLNVAIIYLVTRAANQIPEFRYRIRSGSVIEHEVVHPSTTILGKDDVFSFCTLNYTTDFSQFLSRALEKIACVQKRPRLLEEDQQRDDLLFMTAIPWVSFTSIMHPMRLLPEDSVPRFAWGKYFEEGSKIKMPLSVQGHHALMDGLHAGRFYEEVQQTFHDPKTVITGV
ncbi:chloramphenicol acetyltransferase [Ornatilinea apprima]|uniref:Chloramphenicol acetyltransferase n=1 Tax=Ornatilinea apprima TaxID=1134406 RepID=A0A0P6X7V5_9CHLR|nr:chloramphenicol acetyltransferase [Ornatilinea apprima]KPL78076.1 chloramphenicol acetyltransferase [Ornatilinea apprima]